jgi:hypothetical protein
MTFEVESVQLSAADLYPDTVLLEILPVALLLHTTHLTFAVWRLCIGTRRPDEDRDDDAK